MKVTVERNIHLLSGKYRVLITRRPKNIYGGRFATITQARIVRDELEASVKALQPWGKTPRKPASERRTIPKLRAERRAAGLCQACGDEPPKAGCVSCQSCMDAQHFKRNQKRAELRMRLPNAI